jgi:hypothetical protein
MSDLINYDLPIESADGEEPLLIDANAGFYETQPRGKSYVYVERYVQKKVFFAPLPEGTESSIRPETYLVKTTNYQDMGGGLVMFDRHYAQIPQSWFDYQVVAISTAWVGGLLDARYYLNPNFSGGFQRNTSVLAKVTRKYYLESNIPSDLTLTAPTLEQLGSFSGSVTFSDAIVREDDVSIYLGNIYEVAEFTATVTVVSPR